ncbi:MAG: glycosyl transferase [Pseudonocardia sp. SCN 72-86]|nr:MAG: glycosyl transferase [Pseudonocardia sp. SCN 72-86]
MPARPAADPAPPPLPHRPRRWDRAALAALLAATAVLYLWDLGASGWANAFYSAAAQAGSVSWKAWFFGSSDAANAITVDKTPGALWVMGLSVRVFGLSSWSILVPQALMGVGSVWLLHNTVRRVAGPAAGLIAGAVLALTPVAVLMFRFDNPDALLVLLLVGAAYATTRAVEDGRTRWIVLAGALVGFGFLAKMLQTFLVVPAFAGVWLLAAPVSVGRRIRDLVLAGVALVVAAGWWVLVVALWPAADRPYIGGSQTNSVLELTLGYNGFGRLTGDETGSVGGGPGGGWGETGIGRLFGSEMGSEASWLIPAALLLLVVLLRLSRREPRTGPLRAATVLWGGWLVVTAAVFSFAAGIIHPYYTVALAPAIGALVGIGTVELWRRRSDARARATLAATLAVTACWAGILLSRTAWQPWLTWTIPAVGVLAAVALLGLHTLPRLVVPAVVVAALIGGVGGPAAYAVATAATPHTGAIPSSGPENAGRGFGGGGRGPGQFAGQGAPPNGTVDGTRRGSFGGGGGGRGGGAGGLLGAPTPGAALTALLSRDGSSYTWAAAAVGSNNAAGYQLATQLPVMAVGGFNGTDPAPTLEQFQDLVAQKRIHWFVSGSSGFGGGLGGRTTGTGTGGSDASERITAWVEGTFTATVVDGVTVYDLTAPASAVTS